MARWDSVSQTEEEYDKIPEHKFAKTIRELYWYCPVKLRDSVWSHGKESWWAWKEHEILHRCYCEAGFYNKLVDLVEKWKQQRLEPYKPKPEDGTGRNRHYDKAEKQFQKSA